jgi:hypothetical protein
MKRALGLTMAAFAGVTVLFGTAMYYFATPEEGARYDKTNPDYKYVTNQIQLDWRKSAVDLGRINGGDWQLICVVGGTSDPMKILREEAGKRGVTIAKIEPVRRQSTSGDPLDDSEGAIAFVSRSGLARALLIDGHERLAKLRGHRCFGRETQEVTLPLSEG